MRHLNVYVRLVKSLYERGITKCFHAWATGPLTLLESLADEPDWQVTKSGKSPTFWLSFFLLSSVSVIVSQASMIMAEAITTIQTSGVSLRLAQDVGMV